MQAIVQKCEERVKLIYEQFDASHDMAHIQRVLKNAKEIMLSEVAIDDLTVQLAVLLHDVEDSKYYREGQPTIRMILTEIGATEALSQKVQSCIDSVSFNGGNSKEITSIEGAIVRDADRLDAIGAIGIARTFAFGGAKGRKLYDEDEVARQNMSENEYRSKETASMTHFYEKLLLLKDLMITTGGKKIANDRHAFMELYLQELKKEIGF